MTEIIFRRCLVKVVVGPEPVLTETARAVPRVTCNPERYLVRMTSSQVVSREEEKGHHHNILVDCVRS